jgi:hypothetical protein
LPKMSWSTAMTSSLLSKETVKLSIVVKSPPITKGAARMDHSVKIDKHHAKDQSKYGRLRCYIDAPEYDHHEGHDE